MEIIKAKTFGITKITRSIAALTLASVIAAASASYAFTGSSPYSVSDAAPGGQTSSGASDWAVGYIVKALEENLIPVSLQSAYSAPATRAEFCALAVTAYESSTGTKIESDYVSFSDTDDEYVKKAAAKGIVNGVGEGRFDPDAKLTREQAAVILSRMSAVMGSALPGVPLAFNDSNDISDWAADAVGQMQATGIMGGVGGSMFAPKESYTKEQCIVTIVRLLDLSRVPTGGDGAAGVPENGAASGTQDIGASYKVPKYEIRETLYQELVASDGVLIARNSFKQPVFTGGSPAEQKMNAVFQSQIADIEFDYDYMLDLYEESINSPGGKMEIYIELGDEFVWKESYRREQYISFNGAGSYYGGGAHPLHSMSGVTFDVTTGNELSISDVLTVSERDIADTLYAEYAPYQRKSGRDDLAELALDGYAADSVKERCGTDATFWLALDGLHIYFDEYTFNYAAGESELVIPYSRSDLIRPQFTNSN